MPGHEYDAPLKGNLRFKSLRERRRIKGTASSGSRAIANRKSGTPDARCQTPDVRMSDVGYEYGMLLNGGLIEGWRLFVCGQITDVETILPSF